MFEYLMSSWWFIPFLIFFARILDVSIGTIRLIFISKGLKLYAPILGFFEVLIWLLAVRKVITDVSTPLTLFAYAAGYSTGTYVGMIVEEKVMTGRYIIRIMTKSHFELLDKLNEINQKYTILDGISESGPVKIIYMIVVKQNVNKILEIVKSAIPTAYYTIEDVRYAREDVLPPTKTAKSILTKLNFFKKGK